MKFVERKGSEQRIREGCRDEWRWQWLENEVDGERVGDVIRKIVEVGKAYCLACGKTICYGNRGFVTIREHVRRPCHKKKVKALKRNTTIEGRPV